MDKRYSLQRGVSYASSYTNFHNGTPSDMAEMKFSSAANGGDFDMGRINRDVDPVVSDENMDQKEDEKISCRRLCSYLTIIPMIIGVIALVIVGIIFLPEPTNPPPPKEPLPFCSGSLSPRASASAQSDCSPIAASVKFDISKVRVYYPGNKTMHNTSLSLSDTNSATTVEFWTINWLAGTNKLMVSPAIGALTCNMEGTYLFEYFSKTNTLVYYQTFSLTYLGNLEDVRVTAQPYLEADGISKSIYLSCSMKTGCHHGVLVPELKKGDETLFIHDASCSYSFNISEGGEVTCTTDIEESVWVSKDEVLCSLKPDDGVHKLAQAGQMSTTSADLTNFCSLVSFTIGEPGYINCKKRITGDVDIALERKGHYFGDWTTLLTISDGESKKALDDRLTINAMKIADIMEINITLSEVHCGDKGNLALNYSDGSRTLINIETTSDVPPSCPGSVTKALHATSNFVITCSWCPGHDIEQVLVNHTKTENGVVSMLPSFPISFYLDTKTEHREQNFTVKFTQTYGVARVDITRFKGIGCNYGNDYSITLKSPRGDSSSRNIQVNITIPQGLYTYSMTDTPPIAGRDLEIEFKGFMGCSVSNVIAKKDGVSLLASSVTVADEDIRDAVAFKIVWSYTPVDDSIHNTVINASVSFLPLGESSPRSYSVSQRFDAIDDSICTDFAGCNVIHPNTFGKYIACNGAGLIQGVSSCQAGLSLIFPDPTNCLGQCG